MNIKKFLIIGVAMLPISNPFSTSKKVSVVKLSGVIGDGGLLGGSLNIDGVNKKLEKAFEVRGVSAVAVIVNSPGGSPAQSDLIYLRIRELSEENNVPVYTFAESVAASGGYWLLCAGDEMYALKSSVVGSIGVIGSGFGFTGIMEKLGVERRVYFQGENKAGLDPFSKERPEAVKAVLGAQKILHDNFKGFVRSRRGDKIAVDQEGELFSGAWWVGEQALELGLIDSIGDVRSVMKEKFGKDVKMKLIEEKQGFIGGLTKKFSTSLSGSIANIISSKVEFSKYGL